MQQRSKPQRLLWLIPGVVLVIAGLVAGFSSHQIHQTKPDVYKRNSQSTDYRIATGNITQNIYFYLPGSSEYFVALNGDFDPPISQSDLEDSGGISFVARTDTTSVNADINGTAVTKAHPIEQMTFYDNSGQTMAIYITAEYASYISYPTLDYYQNEWPLGIVLIITGLLVDGLIFLLLLAWQRPGEKPAVAAAQASISPQTYLQPYQVPPSYYPPPPNPGQTGAFYPPINAGQPPQPQIGGSSEQFGQAIPGQPARPPQPQE